jgi:endonuclease G
MMDRKQMLMGLVVAVVSTFGTLSLFSSNGSGTGNAAEGTAASSVPLDLESFEGESNVAGDDEIHSTLRASVFSKGRKQAGMSADEKKWIAEMCQWNTPRVAPESSLGPIVLIVREGYVLGHSSLAKVPYWVCEHTTSEKLNGHGNRKLSKFAPDPKLAQLPRAVLRDYAKSGFDRGHMAPAADEKASQKMMDDCHFLSNMVPQVGPTFNRGIWKDLEETVRKWSEKRGELWIISGPLFYDPLEEDETTADGIVPHQTIGPNHVAVPTHCYKIVLGKNESGDWDAIAFVLDNKTYGRPYQLAHYLTTIDWIEERAGLDFFPELSDDPSNLALMNRLEGTKASMWEEE